MNHLSYKQADIAAHGNKLPAWRWESHGSTACSDANKMHVVTGRSRNRVLDALSGSNQSKTYPKHISAQ